jgi:pimeloyl-ACP methyl ester carboxylesterase
VLLHGWPQTGWCWRRVVDDLARDHTVVVPDLHGYGASDKARTGMDKRTMAADVAALCDDQDQVRGRAIEGCGHFVPEEAAGELTGELRTFLSGA